ncbi:MAG: transporter, partial [Microvirga sp.]|nr:transporter [Microvirga sp.]
MLELFAIVLPVFGLIGIGYVARQTGFVSERVGEGLSEFVFTLSLPCLIFRTLVRAEIPAVQPWGYWISYFAGVAVVWLLATTIGRHFFGIKGVSGVVAGFSAGQANTVFVGIPMILKAYGDEGAVPLFLLIAVHLPVTMTLATILAEGRQASPLV